MKITRSAVIALLLASASFFVSGAANDVFIMQRNSTDTGSITRVMASPPTDGVFIYNTTTVLPQWVTLGANLSIAGGVLNASGGGAQADWNATSGPSQILNKPTLATIAVTGAYADLIGAPTLAAVATSGTYADLSGRPSLAAVATSGAYADLVGIPSSFAPSAHTHSAADIVSGTLADARIPSLAISKTAGLQSALDAKFPAPTGTTAQYVRGDGSLATLPAASSGTVTSVTAGAGLSGGAITTSGTISMPNTGTAGTYTIVTTDAQGRVTAGLAPSQSAATRSLNTAFQVSASRGAWVTYSVQITVTASIAGGQNGDVVLEIASDSGFTTNVQTLSIAGVGQTYTLAVALQGIQPQTTPVSGYVPAGYYARIRTVNNVGTPTYQYRAGQEALL